MTRRELEDELEDLRERVQDTEGDAPGGFTFDSGPDPDPDADIRIKYSVVMRRERAEEEGRVILGPAEDAPDGVVRVAREDSDDGEVSD